MKSGGLALASAKMVLSTSRGTASPAASVSSSFVELAVVMTRSVNSTST
jgi:hypothetical protein